MFVGNSLRSVGTNGFLRNEEIKGCGDRLRYVGIEVGTYFPFLDRLFRFGIVGDVDTIITGSWGYCGSIY